MERELEPEKRKRKYLCWAEPQTVSEGEKVSASCDDQHQTIPRRTLSRYKSQEKQRMCVDDTDHHNSSDNDNNNPEKESNTSEIESNDPDMEDTAAGSPFSSFHDNDNSSQENISSDHSSDSDVSYKSQESSTDHCDTEYNASSSFTDNLFIHGNSSPFSPRSSLDEMDCSGEGTECDVENSQSLASFSYDFEDSEGHLQQSPLDYLQQLDQSESDSDNESSSEIEDETETREILVPSPAPESSDEIGVVGLPPPQRSASHKLINELLSEKYRTQITESVTSCPSEIFLNVLTLVQKHNLSHTVHSHIMQLVNSIFRAPVVPASRYLLDKMYMSYSGVHRHFYCFNCHYYFGNIDSADNSKECDNCGTENIFNDLTKAYFFVTMDIPTQAESKLRDPFIGSKLINPKECVTEMDPMTDLHCGDMYREYASSLFLNDNDSTIFISLTNCVDGSPLFVSSTCEIWPLFFMVNDLPPLLRMKNLILGGLWFGKGKPSFDLFLKPMVDELIQLSEIGAYISVSKEIKHVKIYLTACCVDSGVRGTVQGIHQFNGEYGCSFCLHPGELEREGSSVRKYPYLDEPAALRTEEQVERDAAIVAVMRPTTAAARKPHVNGVVKAGAMLCVPKFKNVRSMIVDYLHVALFGVARQICKLWLGAEGIVTDERGRAPSYYIGSPANLETLDNRIKSLTPPIEVRRLPRVISEFAHWKAREWENFILFYSCPVLKGILPDRYLNHWLLFAQALYLLLKSEVSHSDIDTAENLLKRFCSKLVDLYPNKNIPLKNMTYNMHLILHLPENCRRWGPAWAICSFAFENGNGEVIETVHANRGIPNQILRQMCQKTARDLLKQEISSIRSDSFIESIMSNNVKTCMYVGDVKLFGRKSTLVPSQEESWLLSNCGYNNYNFHVFHKMIYKGCCFKTEALARTNNSFFVAKDGRIFKLRNILVSESKGIVCVLGSLVRLRQAVELPITVSSMVIREVILIEQEKHLLQVNDIFTVCVYSRTCRTIGSYISVMPNIMNVC